MNPHAAELDAEPRYNLRAELINLLLMEEDATAPEVLARVTRLVDRIRHVQKLIRLANDTMPYV